MSLPPNTANNLVPDEVIPHGSLPPLRYRDLPPSIPLRKMVGPSIILAGLALGSGEFILWPYITLKSGFSFFWACMLGVTTQYFINMEITRWALATGESAITGFCRLSRHWAAIFLLMNIIPWVIPAWSVGSAQLISWLTWGAELENGGVSSPYVTPLAIAGLIFCGLILTAGPVVYETVEKIQMFLVLGILVSVVLLACWLVRWDAVVALYKGATNVGHIPQHPDLGFATLLGALAFAGVGGTLNLGQSNYVKEKGYGMGQYIGRITSPLTGKEEPVSEIGYHFQPTPENMKNWKAWWRAAGWEHFLSFFMTCLICLVLLSLISYSIYYQPDGTPNPNSLEFGKGMAFVLGESVELEKNFGSWLRVTFLVMGVAILFTTEFGVLDATSRISTDIVKVNWLRDNPRWTESRLYSMFLWGTISLGVILLLFWGAGKIDKGLGLFELTSSLNGGVMFLYCITLLYLNYFKLPSSVRMSWPRVLTMVWAILFFGFFASWTLKNLLEPFLKPFLGTE